MTNRVFVVTEVTSGLGKALALELAKTGETIVMIARDEEQGNAVRKEIARVTPNPKIDLELCDLSILSSVRNLTEILKSKHEKINVLIHHASAQRRTRLVTVDGYAEMFAANYLGPFLLTNLLLEWLQKAVEADGSARVLNVTPPANIQLNFDDLQGNRNFDAEKAFEAASMANLLFTFALARKLENTGITVNAIDPSPASTKETFALSRFFRWLISQPPGHVSEGIVQMATASKFEKTTGKFLRAGEEIEAPAYAHERVAQEQLWEVSENLSDLTLTKGVTPVNDPHLE